MNTIKTTGLVLSDLTREITHIQKTFEPTPSISKKKLPGGMARKGGCPSQGVFEPQRTRLDPLDYFLETQIQILIS